MFLLLEGETEVLGLLVMKIEVVPVNKSFVVLKILVAACS